jgi:hypothetical protein
MGGFDLRATAQSAGPHASAGSCYICVQPPIACFEASEWDAPCQETCGGNSHAQSCPFLDERCPEPISEIVECM